LVAVTIEKVARAAAAALAHTPWRLERLDMTGRGHAFFTDGKGRLTFEFAFWYPEGAHHLDDEPSIFLKYEEDATPKVGVPYLSGDELPNLRWHASTDDDIERATRAVVRDFEKNFLADAEDRGTLYNRVIGRSLEAVGDVDDALFLVIKRALGEDSATSVTWAERKLSILRHRIVSGRSVFTFDPSLERCRLITTVDDFDAYVATAFGVVMR